MFPNFSNSTQILILGKGDNTGFLRVVENNKQDHF